MNNSDTVTFKHFANAGDLIALLSGVKKIYETYRKKCIIYQQLNIEGHYYNGAVHPTKDGSGVQVMMNERIFEMIKPLVQCQDYIKELRVYNGEKVDVDIDRMRDEIFINMPFGIISKWCGLAFPDMQADISKQWIFVESDNDTKRYFKDKIIINFTERYRNETISYYFLKKHRNNIIFAGTKHEYELFCKKWKLDIQYLEVDDFLELAQAMNSCKFFIGNQSMCYNIAEAMKIPRILELCAFAPNCFCIGDNGYDFLHQNDLEYYFNLLNK